MLVVAVPTDKIVTRPETEQDQTGSYQEQPRSITPVVDNRHQRGGKQRQSDPEE